MESKIHAKSGSEEQSPTGNFSQKPALFTRQEIAPTIRISVRKLDAMTKNRQIPCYRLGGKILYRLDRVLAALEALEVQEAHR